MLEQEILPEEGAYMSCEGEQAYYVTSYEVEVDEVTAQPRCLVGFSCGKTKR